MLTHWTECCFSRLMFTGSISYRPLGLRLKPPALMATWLTLLRGAVLFTGRPLCRRVLKQWRARWGWATGASEGTALCFPELFSGEKKRPPPVRVSSKVTLPGCQMQLERQIRDSTRTWQEEKSDIASNTPGLPPASSHGAA